MDWFDDVEKDKEKVNEVDKVDKDMDNEMDNVDKDKVEDIFLFFSTAGGALVIS